MASTGELPLDENRDPQGEAKVDQPRRRDVEVSRQNEPRIDAYLVERGPQVPGVQADDSRQRDTPDAGPPNLVPGWYPQFAVRDGTRPDPGNVRGAGNDDSEGSRRRGDQGSVPGRRRSVEQAHRLEERMAEQHLGGELHPEAEKKEQGKEQIYEGPGLGEPQH